MAGERTGLFRRQKLEGCTEGHRIGRKNRREVEGRRKRFFYSMPAWLSHTAFWVRFLTAFDPSLTALFLVSFSRKVQIEAGLPPYSDWNRHFPGHRYNIVTDSEISIITEVIKFAPRLILSTDIQPRIYSFTQASTTMCRLIKTTHLCGHNARGINFCSCALHVHPIWCPFGHVVHRVAPQACIDCQALFSAPWAKSEPKQF